MQGSEESGAVRALAAAEPEWLAARRREAWDRATQLPLPTGTEETWRYTDVASLDPRRFRPLAPGAALPPARPVPARAEELIALRTLEPAGELLEADGAPATSRLAAVAGLAGVRFQSLEAAAREAPELVEPHLGRLVGAVDLFTARNLALHRGGFFLHVPAGVRLAAPFQALSWLQTPGAELHTRNLIVVEAGAEVFINDLTSSDPLSDPSLAAPVTELWIGDGARVGWLSWQGFGPGVRHLGHLKARLGRDARLESLQVTLGGDFSRSWFEVELAGQGARSDLWGLYFTTGQQRVEHWTVQDHVAPHTTSDLLYRGALAGESRSVYYGTIRVAPGARRTDAYQANRNLLLSSGAKADTNPQLEIANNDVRCTHGATVGPIDEEQLFYLESRGLARSQAEELIVTGFMSGLLERAAWSQQGDRILEALRAKLRGAG